MKKVIFLLIVYASLVTPVLAQSVDLLWQGNGYTSPFYHGHTLWSDQSTVTIFALPQGLGNPTNLDYKWTRNGTVLGSLSGKGKSSLTLMDPALSKSLNIKVQIVSAYKDILAENTLTISTVAPELLIYENSALYGFMFHQALKDSYKIPGQEVSFESFPFFFNTSSRADNSLTYEWATTNGKGESKSSVTYRIPEGSKGSSRVDVRVTSIDKILQEAHKSFLVQFGEAP